MLTMRGPIQLKTGLSLTAGSEAFSQRIIGNYGLMTAHVAPRDLLFLLTAPPELPEDLGGVTSLNLQNTFSDVRNVTMEVVNNVVNRIILDQENRFTYQDQVYITSVLRKLGVNDVTHFMEEVRRLREEQRDQRELTRLYRQEVTQKALAALAPPEQGRRWPEAERGGDEPGKASETRYDLHQQIYRRLHTGDIYQEISAFQHSVSQLGDMVENNQLKLSEQLRLSRSLHLEELRSQSLHGGPMTLQYHINRYETGELLPPPDSEESVLAQAAEAALLSTIDNVVTHTLTREKNYREVWMNLERSFSQTAENTLSRFESYHSGGLLRREESRTYQQWRETLEREELTQLQKLSESWLEREQIIRTEGNAQVTPAGRTPAQIEHLEPVQAQVGGEEEQKEGLSRGPGLSPQDLTRLTQQILSSGVQKGEVVPPQKRTEERAALPQSDRRTLRERELYYASVQAADNLRELAQLQRELLLLERAGGAAALPELPEAEYRPAGQGSGSAVERAAALVREIRHRVEERQAAPAGAGTREEVLRQLLLPAPAAEETERTAAEQAMQELPERPGLVREQMETDLQRLSYYEKLQELRLEHIQTPGPAAEPPAVPPEVSDGAAGQAGAEGIPGAAGAEALAREVQALDRLNRERYERLQELRLEHLREQASRPPDPKRTMDEAFQALDAPEQVLRQLLESSEDRPKRATPPEVEQILRQADPMTRQIYESLLQYQRDPAAAAAQGLVRPSHVGAFNADAKRREAQGGRLEHPRPAEEAQQAAEQAPFQPREELLDTLRELPQHKPPQAGQARERGKAPIVLRREDNSVFEELIARLEERRTMGDVTQVSREDVRHTAEHQVEIRDQTSKVVTQTTEDITALVNRTMARQMNAITDKVYRQMERKLQMERSRRGRL